MGLAKYAAFEVLSARIAQRGEPTEGIRRWAHRHDFTYEPKPGYLYVRSRAISSRTNDNFDTFPAAEIKKAYRTFVGKPVFVNHHNENHRRMRGVIVDAVLHEDTNPDGTPDTWVEVLHEIDAVRFPKLAEAIVNGWMDRTSMGTDVAFSVCSFCGNKASTPLEYCQHIPRLKGRRIRRHTASGPQDVLVHEICYGLGFFENSHLVEDPADPTAFTFGVDTRGLEAAGIAVKASKTATPDEARDWDLSPEERDQIEEVMQANAAYLASTYEHKVHLACGDTVTYHSATRNAVQPGETWHCSTHGDQFVTDVSGWGSDYQGLGISQWGNPAHASLQVMAPGPPLHPDHEIRAIPSSRGSQSWKGSCTCGWKCPHLDRDIITAHLHALQHMGDIVQEVSGGEERGLGADIADQLLKSRGGVKTALPIEPHPLPRVKKPKYPNAGDHPDFKVLPVSSQHVIDHWYKGTPEEHHQGERWYEDAHHVANALTMGDSDLGGGILSAYSPQASWPANLFNAMRTFHSGRALQKGEGQVMGMHSKAVGRMLNGEHWSNVLTAPKTYAFAHLISTGGKDPETGSTLGDVVIDRHAMSVAAGRRMVKGGDDERAMSNILGNPNTYEHVAQAYRDAAAEISKREGREIAPYQVQAATWLTRQRLNDDEIKGLGDPNQLKLLKGRDTAQHNVYQRWKTDVRKQWPGMLDTNMHDAALHDAVQRIVTEAYGETKAPPDVDTLRDEQCPICGDQDNFNGDQCAVCGYIAPPAEFQDPDLEKAKQLDLRKDTFEDDPTGPTLQCDTCGAQFPADETPQPGDEDLDEDEDPNEDSAVVEEDVVPGGSDPANAAKPDPKVKRKTKVSVSLDRDKDPQAPGPQPNPAADPDATFAVPGQNATPDDDDEQPTEIAPEEGDTCPDCGKGTLHLVGPEDDEDDDLFGDEDDDPLAANDPQGEESDSEKPDPGAVPFKKKTSAMRKVAAATEGRGVGMSTQNPAQRQRTALFEALTSQQRRIEAQSAQINGLQRALGALARLAGVEKHPVFASLVTADVNNPAQPIPDPPAEGPSETTQQAATPEGKDDPQNQGETSGVNEGVTPDATTTLDNSNVVLDAQPFTELQDPTKPVSGTEGPRPLSEVKTETDVRAGNPNNPDVAFPLEGPFAQRPTTGAKQGESRLIAAMRLGRLRKAAYGEEGDDLSLGQEIADSDLTDEAISIETAALSRSVEAAARKTPSQQRTDPVARSLVPRAASQVTRTVPSVAPGPDDTPIQATSSSHGLDSALFE